MGAVLSVFFGLGPVLLSYIQTLGSGDQGGVGKFIYGQTATMTELEAGSIGVVALLSIVTSLALRKEFRLVCFDPEFAQAQGWPVNRIDLLMMALVVAVTVIGMRAVGLVLIIALVIIPAAAARFWTERMGHMVLIAAAAIGGLSVLLGAAASAVLPDMPAGAVIVLVAGAMFLTSLLLAPRRGLLAAAVRRARLRVGIASQHVLCAAYEDIEGGRAKSDGVPDLSTIRCLRSWSRPWLVLVVRILALRGLVVSHEGGLALTPAGAVEAACVTRNHRLWGQFLVTYAELAPSHVDHSADLVEHVISPEMVAKLERELAAVGRLPRAAGVPPSLHPLGAGVA